MFSRNNCNRKTYVSSMSKWLSHQKNNVLNGSTTVRSLKTYEMHSGGQSHTIDFIAIQLAQNIACVQN